MFSSQLQTKPAGFLYTTWRFQTPVQGKAAVFFASKPYYTAQPLAAPLGNSPCSESWGDFMGQFYVVRQHPACIDSYNPISI